MDLLFMKTYFIAIAIPSSEGAGMDVLTPKKNHSITNADELIRQVTINCAERGLLLLRVRDEIRMTKAAYQTLYESSIAFGIRKALIAEQRKAKMESKVCLTRSSSSSSSSIYSRPPQGSIQVLLVPSMEGRGQIYASITILELQCP